MSEREVRRAAALSDELRRWLRARREPPESIASALGYELAAIIARHAERVEDADTVIDQWTTVMKEQVRTFGIGREHP